MRDAGLFQPPRAQRARPSEDRGQRRSQLVRQGGQELVLDAVGLQGLGIQSVLDRDRAHLGELRQDGLVLFAEVALLLFHQVEQADGMPVAPAQRDREPAFFGRRRREEFSPGTAVLHGAPPDDDRRARAGQQ